MKSDTLAVENHILNRDYFPIIKISLRKFLESTGMDQYHHLCFTRIKDSKLIDNIEVKYDNKTRDDLLLTGKGLNKCYDIISGYIDGEMIKEFAKSIDARNDYAISINHVLKTLRNMPEKKLKGLENIILTSTQNNDYEQFIYRCIQTEFESRKLSNRIRALCTLLIN